MARIKAKKTETLVPADSIGGKLRRAREEKGISLEEAHRSTKIHPTVLEAMEDDRLENILGKAYVKGFLKNYAHYLGLDANSVLQEYASKRTTAGSSDAITFVKRPVMDKRHKRFRNIVIVTLAFVAWFYILGFATVKFMGRYRQAAEKRRHIAAERIELPKAETIDTAKALIPIPQSRTVTLTLTASNDVWLKVTQDGAVAFHGILSKNSKETWRADKEIKLSEIGKPEALKLNVNGQDIDLSAKRLGKSLIITHKGLDIEPKP